MAENFTEDELKPIVKPSQGLLFNESVTFSFELTPMKRRSKMQLIMEAHNAASVVVRVGYTMVLQYTEVI